MTSLASRKLHASAFRRNSFQPPVRRGQSGMFQAIKGRDAGLKRKASDRAVGSTSAAVGAPARRDGVYGEVRRVIGYFRFFSSKQEPVLAISIAKSSQRLRRVMASGYGESDKLRSLQAGFCELRESRSTTPEMIHLKNLLEMHIQELRQPLLSDYNAALDDAVYSVENRYKLSSEKQEWPGGLRKKESCFEQLDALVSGSSSDKKNLLLEALEGHCHPWIREYCVDRKLSSFAVDDHVEESEDEEKNGPRNRTVSRLARPFICCCARAREGRDTAVVAPAASLGVSGKTRQPRYRGRVMH